MPLIHRLSTSYHRWLGARLELNRTDLRFKSARMREDGFQFFRGSFFHWAHEWKYWCPALADAPMVVAVGDIHVENFGTWRDAEGRLVWGVNDFDEAWPLPYTNDLLRLAASAILAGGKEGLSLGEGECADAIVQGYWEGLEARGRPFVLAEHHDTLRRLAVARLREADKYWEKLMSATPQPGAAKVRVGSTLLGTLPAGSTDVRWFHRRAGIGSLGRSRITLVANWLGSKVAREAKAAAPSACAWVEGRTGPRRRWNRMLQQNSLRCPDPFVGFRGTWLVRRLAPDCSRIELADLGEARDERHLLEAMGWELANVHLAGGRRKAIMRDLSRRDANWLRDAANHAVKETRKAFAEWSSR